MGGRTRWRSGSTTIPTTRGRFGGALLFVRWTVAGDAPDGHLESDYLVWGKTELDARERLGALSLYDVKAILDELIATGRADES